MAQFKGSDRYYVRLHACWPDWKCGFYVYRIEPGNKGEEYLQFTDQSNASCVK